MTKTKKANITTTTYKVESRYFKNFLIDIQASETEFSSWIYRNGSVNKKYLMGFNRSYNMERTIEEFTEDILEDMPWIDQEAFAYLQEFDFNDEDDCE